MSFFLANFQLVQCELHCAKYYNKKESRSFLVPFLLKVHSRLLPLEINYQEHVEQQELEKGRERIRRKTVSGRIPLSGRQNVTSNKKLEIIMSLSFWPSQKSKCYLSIFLFYLSHKHSAPTSSAYHEVIPSNFPVCGLLHFNRLLHLLFRLKPTSLITRA